ncbi:M48 family metalloprotease [Siminovitchia sp. FSL W7-1587]|uniref:M48 family metalloprotease n=1 Tax=Siminovitchia sp. FSL W7-1587 TaxID=2954699 RepID=UPI0030CFE1E7
MKRTAFICLLVAAFLTAAVMLIELVVRSPMSSPLILFDSKSEAKVPKLLTGYSIYHGHYLLEMQRDTQSHEGRPLAFRIGSEDYQLKQIHPENVSLPAGQEMKVMTRRGIDVDISNGTSIQSNKRSFFFNEYTIRPAESDTSISIQLRSEFGLALTLLIYFGSFLLPSLLALAFNHVFSWRPLFTLFFPFILAGLLPLLLNYHFTMGYGLLLTGSYIWSIVLCIFLPAFLAIALTAAIYQYTLNSEEDEVSLPEMEETGFLYWTRRETIGILMLMGGGIAYFFALFSIPLSVYVNITEKWYLFIAWYLSVTFMIMIVYTAGHRFIGNYENIGLQEPFASLKKAVEQACGTNVNLFKKKESRNETNAWVYTVPFASKKGINIYMTEGLMKNFTLAELQAILFHEIGHIKLKHGRLILATTICAMVAISSLMFFARKIMLGYGWGYYTFLLSISMVGVVMLMKWLPNKISKLFEHQADEYAVRQLEDAELYIRTLVKLHDISEEEEGEWTPKRKEWKETHPSLQKRIHYIKGLHGV